MELGPVSITYDNPDWLCLHDHVPQTEKFVIDRKKSTGNFDTSQFLDFEYDYRKYKNKVTLFSDYISYKEDDKHFCLDRIFLSAYFLAAIKSYKEINCSFVDGSQKDINFCAFMNKARPSRLLTSFWLSKNFNDEQNFFYTQGFGGSVLSKKLSGLIKNTKYESWLKKKDYNLLAPKFIDRFRTRFRKNYQHVISAIEKRSLLSIVNEPTFFEKGNFFTEKTLQSCLSCCVPFFVHMYEGPEYFEKLGFYAFKDLIDYSDSCEPDPVIRTLKLLDANMDLLTYGFDINKYKYEIEHNFYHAQDSFGVLKKIYEINDQKLFQEWFEVIVNEIAPVHNLQNIFKKLEKVL